MAESVRKRLAVFNNIQDRVSLEKLLEALVDSIESNAQKLDALVVVYNATLAKLDLDAGVTDADYASSNPGVGGAETAHDNIITKV